MDTNTLFQSLDSDHELSSDAKIVSGTLDMMTSRIVGRLIQDRLIDYAQQPGQTVEYLAAAVADELLRGLKMADSVELSRLLKWGPYRNTALDESTR